MRKAMLLYNPFSGRRRTHRTDVEVAAAVLREAGIKVLSQETLGGQRTSEQVREAIADDCDAVFACGGDGTIHDVLQALVDTEVALGIIPLGTANALAHDLGIPFSAMVAAQMARTARPKRFPVGVVEYKDLAGNTCKRYFAIAAGIGMDARIFYDLTANMKLGFGAAAYYAMAWRLWWRKKEHFVASCDGQQDQYRLTELLAVRIKNFGGVLGELAPGASFDHDKLRVVLCETESRFSYLSYMVRAMFRTNWRASGIKLVDSLEIRCDYSGSTIRAGRRVYVEADGELLGTLPARITLKLSTLSLLVPGA